MKKIIILSLIITFTLFFSAQNVFSLPFNHRDLDIDFSGTVNGNIYKLFKENTDLEIYTGVNEGELTPNDLNITIFLDLSLPFKSEADFLNIRDLLDKDAKDNSDPGKTGIGTFTLNAQAAGKNPEPDRKVSKNQPFSINLGTLVIPKGTKVQGPTVPVSTIAGTALFDLITALPGTPPGVVTFENQKDSFQLAITLEGKGKFGTPVPEPSTMLLLFTGLIGLVGIKKKLKG